MRAAVAVLCSILLAACGGTQAPPPEREEVLIGLIANLNDRSEQATVRGVDMAVAEYNADPDRIYDVRVRRFNTKGDQGAVDAATRAVATERLVGVVGPFAETQALAAAPVFAQANFPAMFPTVSTVGIRSEGWTGFRRMSASRSQLAGLLVADVGSRVRGGVVVLHGDDPDTVAAVGAVGPLVARLKIQVTRQEAIGPKADLKAVAASVASSGAGGVVLLGDPNRSKAVIDALRQAGYKGVTAAERLREMPQPPAESLTVSGIADPSSRSLEALSQDYSGKYDAAMPAGVAETFEGATMVLEAIEETDPEPRAVAAFLRLNGGFLGDTKRYDYDASGEMVDPPGWVYIFKGGWKLSGLVDPGKKVILVGD